jgi:hypothetical protein
MVPGVYDDILNEEDHGWVQANNAESVNMIVF